MEVSCNNCGATLQVEEQTRFVTCGACRSRLAVQRSGTSIFTHVIEKKDPLPAGVETKPPEGRAARLAEKLQYSIKDLTSNTGTGVARKPSAVAGVVSIFLGILAGAFMIALVRHGAPVFFLGFGFLFFGAGVYNGFKAIDLAMKQRK